MTDILLRVPKYRRKQKKCEAGNKCQCRDRGLGLFGLLEFFYDDLTCIQLTLESDHPDEFDYRCELLEEINPCFFRTVRELLFDLLRGKIIIDDEYSEIFKYKAVLLKICRPQIPHSKALCSLLHWNKIFPKLVPLWWECLYRIKEVCWYQEDQKKKWAHYLKYGVLANGRPVEPIGSLDQRKEKTKKKAEKDCGRVAGTP
jgi:hypothetical protein